MGLLVVGIAALVGLFALAVSGKDAALTSEQVKNIVLVQLAQMKTSRPVAVRPDGDVVVDAGNSDFDVDRIAEAIGASLKLNNFKRAGFGKVYVKRSDNTRMRNLPLW
jgi:hypothetical protein